MDNRRGGRWLEQALVALVVVSVCLHLIESVVPHLVGPLIAVGVVVIAIRIVFDRTRPW